MTHAADATTWTAASGDWSAAANCSAGVPTANVDALFDRSGVYAVTLTSASAARDVSVLNGPLTLDAAGQTLAVRDLTLGTAAGLDWTGGGSLIARVPRPDRSTSRPAR